jgi:hypothetical protein
MDGKKVALKEINNFIRYININILQKEIRKASPFRNKVELIFDKLNEVRKLMDKKGIGEMLIELKEDTIRDCQSILRENGLYLIHSAH